MAGIKQTFAEIAKAYRTPCIAHHEWKRVAHDVHSFFDTRTLADLLQSGRPGATRDADDRSTASLP